MRKKIVQVFTLMFFFSICIAPSAGAIVPANSNVPEFDPALVKSALMDLKSLPRKERNQKLKHAKSLIRDYREAKRAGQEPDTNTLLLAILAILLPPLAVYLHQGVTNNKFWITLLLFTLGILGAFTIGWYLILASIVYALLVILGEA